MRLAACRSIPPQATTIQRPTSIGWAFCLQRSFAFISGFRDTTRGSAPICMCHAVAPRRPEVARFDSLLLSVLSKPAPTSSREHTQAAFRGQDLRVRHCHRLSIALGWRTRPADTSCIDDVVFALRLRGAARRPPGQAVDDPGICAPVSASLQRSARVKHAALGRRVMTLRPRGARVQGYSGASVSCPGPPCAGVRSRRRLPSACQSAAPSHGSVVLP